MRRTVAAALAFVALAVVAGPSGAANEVTTSGSTVRVRVPLSVEGAVDTTRALEALEAQAAALARDRLYGCFGLDAEFVTDAGGSDAPHRLTVLAQRPGQFVRPTSEGSADPFEGARVLYLGEQALQTPSPLEGAAGLLLGQAGSEIEGGAAGLVDYVIRHTDTTFSLKPCRWTGTVEITTVYDRYHLTVTAAVDFSFTVDPTGFVDGTVAETTRSATADDPEVGSCSGSGLEMFAIGLTGAGQPGGFELRFEPKGMEPDFSMSCSRGSLDIGGDYIRAAFLPTGRLEYDLKARDGANATHSDALQGRNVTAKVTIRRG